MDEVNVARQSFPDVLIPNGHVDILKSDYIIQTDLMHGDKMIGYYTEPIPDIDTELDWRLLSCYSGCEKAINDLLQYLETI